MIPGIYSPDTYNGNGSTTVFAITFEFLSTSSNVVVSLKNTTTGVITPQTTPTHYSISGSNVTFVTAPPSGYTVILELQLDELQSTDYREYDLFPAATHETALDKLTLETQVIGKEADRSLKVDAAVTGFDATIVGTPAAGQIPVVNDDEDGIEFRSAASLNALVLGTGVEDFLATPSSANLRTAMTDETGTGALVFKGGDLTGCTGLTESGLTLADNTTNDASTSKHGFLKKLSNVSTQFMNGEGNWAVPTGGVTVSTQIFTSSGTYTPTSGMLYCIVELIGGGAGGGGTASVSSSTAAAGAGGGGAGGYARKVFSAATIGASQTVTIGGAGAGGTAGANNGSNGGTTSLGALLSATGGTGGGGASSVGGFGPHGAGGAGGTGGGDVNITGGTGVTAMVYGPQGGAMSGQGASSMLGAGGTNTGSNTGGGANGKAATGYGAGGGGAASGNNSTAQSGGAGTAGIIIITEFK